MSHYTLKSGFSGKYINNTIIASSHKRRLICSVIAQFSDREPCGDDQRISIANQSSLSLYSGCSSLGDVLINPEFVEGDEGFVLPNVESVQSFKAGYLGPKDPGSSRVDSRVETVVMKDLRNVTAGGMFLAYLPDLASIEFP